jgi:DNA polymerase-3 subunit gamma/tau
VPKTPPKQETPGETPLAEPSATAHRALALAYRPQTFEDVAGQRHVTDVLAKAVEHNRVAHAYLFSGPRGTGKSTTARILAKVLNCPNRVGVAPCNVCDTCRDITSGVSLDVVEIDGASNRGIADIQQLREAVRFAATGGRSKVYIIDEVHQLSGDAFAALLKTLEEPPPHVVFIFATTDPLKLPDTIRSRTQRYEFARVTVKTIAERLKTIAALETAAGRTLELTDGAALLIARKAEGGLRDAVSALDQVASTGRVTIDEAAVSDVLGLVSREAFFDLAEPMFARDPANTLAALHRAYAAGFDPKDLADGLLEHLRNVLVLKVDPNGGDLLAATPEETARYIAQGAEHSSADVLRLIRITTDTIALLRDASQPLLHLEAALLEMAQLEPGRTLAEILERLEAIEDAAPGGGGGGARPGVPPASAPTRSAPPPPPVRRMEPPAPTPTPVRVQETPAVPPVRPIPGLESVRPMPTRAPRPVEGGPPPGPAEFDQPGMWEKVVALVLQRKRMLGHFLETARPLGWQDNVLVLEVDPAHRGLIEHRDNRAPLIAALNEVYGRALDYRCVDAAPGATTPRPQAQVAPPEPAASPELEEPPHPSEVPAGSAEPSTALDTSAAEAPVPTAPPTPPAATPGPAPVQRKHPAELSPEARNTMLWLEGEIVGPPRPNLSS